MRRRRWASFWELSPTTMQQSGDAVASTWVLRVGAKWMGRCELAGRQRRKSIYTFGGNVASVKWAISSRLTDSTGDCPIFVAGRHKNGAVPFGPRGRIAFADSGRGGGIDVWREDRMEDSVHISMCGVNGKLGQWGSAIEHAIVPLGSAKE